jgi:hypothetical protein
MSGYWKYERYGGRPLLAGSSRNVEGVVSTRCGQTGWAVCKKADRDYAAPVACVLAEVGRTKSASVIGRTTIK